MALCLGAACAAPLEDPERFTGSLTCPDNLSVENDIFAETCAGSVCHSPGEQAGGGLDLVSPGVSERIADIESPNCSGEVLAVPGDPDASLIVRKLGSDPPCGSRMPLIGELEPGEVACVRDYIEGLGGD